MMGVRPHSCVSRLHPDWKVVIHAFFDDSGSERDPSSRFPCLAGYLAHETYWMSFNDIWRHLLLRHGLPYLHMREFVKMSNDRGWSQVHRNSVVLEFVHEIKQCRLIGFGVGVDADVWRNLPKERRSVFGDAQQFCFMRIVRRVVARADKTQSSQRFRELTTALPLVDLEFAAGEFWDQAEIDKEFPKIEATIALMRSGQISHSSYLLNHDA
jgi:hypothetical protein